MASTEDESSIEASLDLYRSQLRQVEESLESVGRTSVNAVDLLQLQDDLTQLIQLTEESLLALKKKKLLSLLATYTSELDPTTSQAASESPSIDDELVAFQRALSGGSESNKGVGIAVEKHSGTNNGITTSALIANLDSDKGADHSEYVTSSDSDDEDDSSHDVATDADLSGEKCRVSYCHSWGEMTDHNAMILCSEPNNNDDPCDKIRVVFCNPTSVKMRPCPYFLEGKCRFSDDECRFSHGEVVSVTDLKPFKEPDFSLLSIGSRCLAMDTDNVWYPATIVDAMPDFQFKVQYDSGEAVSLLDIQHILPTGGHSEDEDDSGETNNEVLTIESDDSDDVVEIPTYLWRPNRAVDAIGTWEEHTRGIGSKLMAKMGFVVGQGLGKHGEGRAEPVPIELLPQGVSLDKIMELRALAGNKDLYDAMKKEKRKQKKINIAAAKSAFATSKKPSEKSVFDFINHKLNHKATAATSRRAAGPVAKVKNISVSDLKGKSDKHVNIQMFKTQEEIKKTNLEIQRLEASLARNEGQDHLAAKRFRAKLASLRDYLKEIEASKLYLEQHLMNRKAHNALAKF